MVVILRRWKGSSECSMATTRKMVVVVRKPNSKYQMKDIILPGGRRNYCTQHNLRIKVVEPNKS